MEFTKIKPRFSIPNLTTFTVTTLLLMPNISWAEVEVDIGGWLRAEYGVGERYEDDKGDNDTLGVSKAALSVTANHHNYEAVLVVGMSEMSGDSNANGDVTVKDAFIVWRELGGTDFTLSAGIQPLMFGLKASGYVDDRTLQGSLEFGGAGGFAVSNQAGPAIILEYNAGETLSWSFGAFDTTERKGAVGPVTEDGSTLAKNQFVQFKYDSDGLYGVAGVERRYIGGEVDDSKIIYDIGLGYNADTFDASLEYIHMDRGFVDLLDDEAYVIAEVAYHISKDTSVLLDWSTATESNIDTLRLSYTHQIDKALEFHVAYAIDDIPAGEDSDSLDFRLTYTF